MGNLPPKISTFKNKNVSNQQLTQYLQMYESYRDQAIGDNAFPSNTIQNINVNYQEAIRGIRPPGLVVTENNKRAGIHHIISSGNIKTIDIDPTKYRMNTRDKHDIMAAYLIAGFGVLIIGVETFDINIIPYLPNYAKVYYICKYRKITPQTTLRQKEIEMNKLKSKSSAFCLGERYIEIPLQTDEINELKKLPKILSCNNNTANSAASKPKPHSDPSKIEQKQYDPPPVKSKREITIKEGEVYEFYDANFLVFSEGRIQKIVPLNNNKFELHYKTNENVNFIILPDQVDNIRFPEAVEYDLIDQTLRKEDRFFGLHLVEAENLGDCAFVSFDKAMGGDGSNKAELRKRVVGHMKSNRAKYEELYNIAYMGSLRYKSFDYYLEKIALGGTGGWGDNLCITALSEIYGVDVEIIELDVLTKEFMYLRNPEPTTPQKTLIYLVRVQKVHYDALVSLINNNSNTNGCKNEKNVTWNCSKCTMENSIERDACEVCSEPKVDTNILIKKDCYFVVCVVAKHYEYIDLKLF